jgi:hypothetical protein
VLCFDYITFAGFSSEYLIIVESEFKLFFKNIVTCGNRGPTCVTMRDAGVGMQVGDA